MKTNVRPAELADYPRIKRYDEFIGDRRLDLQAGELTVADQGERRAIGYARVWATAFLGWPLVAALCVQPDLRRTGVAAALLSRLVEDARFPRLYLSTEEGNEAMRALLAARGARRIGHADELNIGGERELLYRLR